MDSINTITADEQTSTRQLRMSFTVLLLIALALYVALCTKEYLGLRLAASNDASDVLRAARLEGKNAEIWARIGRIQLYSLNETARAKESLRQSLELNPHEALTWLTLAEAERLDGNLDAEIASVEGALKADPTTPETHWRAGTYNLSHGNQARAIEEFSFAVRHSSRLLYDGVHVVWNITRSPEEVLRILPRTEEAHLYLLRYFVWYSEVQAAGVAWDDLAQRDIDLNRELASDYVELLLRSHDIDQAIKVWDRFCSKHLQVAVCDRTNAIKNSGFEEVFDNKGFDWHIQPATGVSAFSDSTNAFEGSRSLRIEYDDSADLTAGVYQLVPLLPNHQYTLSGAYKCDGLTALNPPRLYLHAADTLTLITRTPSFEGSGSWKTFSVSFNSGDERLARLQVLHVPSEGPIHGVLWIDALKLEPQ
jgi:tetratricopeptide (TPR) repeat protein